MKTNEEILNLYRERIKLYGGLHGKMRQIQDIYHGQAKIPLPEVERTQMPSIPNLLAQGVDQMAGRIASVTPTVTFAAKDPNKRSEHRRSATASRVVSGYWQSDRLMMKMKQRARHMIAYGMSPCVVRWDYKTGRPNWQIRNPMECSLTLIFRRVRCSRMTLFSRTGAALDGYAVKGTAQRCSLC